MTDGDLSELMTPLAVLLGFVLAGLILWPITGYLDRKDRAAHQQRMDEIKRRRER